MPEPSRQARQLYYQKLKEAKASDTVSRSVIFATLYESGHQPLTMAELIKRTKSYANRVSIYRSVALLEKIGVVKRLNTGWKYKLELSDDFLGHHHHITCDICKQTVVMKDSPELENQVKKIAYAHEYNLTDHHLDISGVCKQCQQKSS